ncbi:MAG: RluA family pseudouridine synthase [Bacteroidales bacterium]|nr:RluA family pseudouridine synthase [Bacteroidales bacterium]
MSSYADLLNVLYEDNHCLALDKPAGWSTTHAEGDEQTLDQLAKAYLKEKYDKPGNVFLGVVHRLDKPVSGCLLFARTSKAAARLSEQFRAGAIEKVYWAVVDREMPNDTGSLEDWLWHDDANHRVIVVPPHTPGAKLARLLYTVRARHGGMTWLELRPHTGRKHQLRVQLASRGFSIHGDAKYGSPHKLGHAIALHAHSLTFLHPTQTHPITLTAPVPRHWRGRFAYLLRGSWE